MFLLDTSALSHAVNPSSSKFKAVSAFFANSPLFLDQMYVSVVTISEAQFGFEILKWRATQGDSKATAERLTEVKNRISRMSSLGTVLPVTSHIAKDHAILRSAWAQHQVPKMLMGSKLKNKHVELWHENVPPNVLQISENDLWIAATAITHSLTLVTVDRDHQRLTSAHSDLIVQQL